ADLRRLCQQHPHLGRTILDRLAEVVSSRWKNARAQVRSMLAYGVREATATQKQEMGEKAMTTTMPQHSKEEQLRGLIEQLSAYVEQFHGGSVEFVSFDGKVLKVRLGGACLGCPLSPATLRGWVAGTVHQFFPDVEVVEAGQGA
ncbi:MAG: NifU family protein, partial [Anaerolineae bacterium]